jgi:hypothetical protein
MNRLLHGLLISTVLLLVTACGKEKKDALATIDKVKAACAANQRKEALDMTLAEAEKNETFGRSLRNVTPQVPDKSTLDVCTDLPDRIKKDIEER